MNDDVTNDSTVSSFPWRV